MCQCCSKTVQAEQLFHLTHVDDPNIEGIHNVKQEAIDSLIATRASYESTIEGAVQVLNRSYQLDTSQYELIHHPDLHVPNTESGRTQPFVMVRSSNGYTIVACRGTFSLWDVVQDVKVAKAPLPFTRKGRAHLGFLERAMLLPIDLLLNLLRAGEKLIITGHSLGGAVSSLLTLRLLEALASVPVPGHQKLLSSDRLRCITFGTAPFADLELSNYVNSHYRHIFHNFVSKHDVVPRAHNVLPHVLFPAAKWFVDTWEFRTCRVIVESATAMPVVTAAKKLEERMHSLWPATRLLKFILECAAGDEESLFYGHCGYLALLDPDSQNSESSPHMEKMESLGQEFCIEDKSVSDVFWEHGLQNYYTCLVNSFSTLNTPACEMMGRRSSWHLRLNETLAGVASFLSDLSVRSILLQSNRAMIRAAGNDF